MIVNIYTIYDVKAEAYLTPFFLQNDAILKRIILDTLSDPEHLFAKHPEDYVVFKCGTFDDQTGDITPLQPIHVMYKLIDFKPVNKED